MFDLARYCQRIGFIGQPTADIDTLQRLHAAHTNTLAFENVDVLLNRGIKTDIDSVVNKLIYQGRGGYCFEHNGLLLHVLRHIGFEVEPLMARSVWQLPAGAAAGPKTHMVLKVSVDQQVWLADVGFGGVVLPTPVRWVFDEAQTTSHESFRLLQVEDGDQLQILLGDEWTPMYTISAERQHPIDFDVANWFTSTHPNSKFRLGLIAARVTSDTRYALLNNRLTVRQKNAAPQQRLLSLDELMHCLEHDFGLAVESQWQEVLQPLLFTE